MSSELSWKCGLINQDRRWFVCRFVKYVVKSCKGEEESADGGMEEFLEINKSAMG